MDILDATAARFPDAPAIDDGQRVLCYRELVAEVAELGLRLQTDGIGWGDRVGIQIPSGTADLYVSILAVLAAGAAYVPVDFDDPDERARLVFEQARACATLGDRRRLTRLPGAYRRAGQRRPCPADDAWIIFTSGSTGTPKGVAVTHRNAAAFVDAEAELFARERPLGPGDRVLAGLSVAFDASCEEMWLAWRHGACLVPAPRSLVKGGAELGEWLTRREISVVSTVPTLAGLLPSEHLSGVRLLILGGESCPDELAARLVATCPEVWNTYGPTEATVVASAARLTPDGPVRIGLPLCGWQLAVADPHGRLVGWGEVGELVIAGVGLARYLDPEKDAASFVSLPRLRWSRVYRSGDMVRADPQGLIYLGRVDSQVKIRGYRVELSEIEAVLLRTPGIVQAVVSTYQAQPGVVELVGYYTTGPGAVVDQRALQAQLRAWLPAHMVPAYLQQLARIPMLTSGKADRNNLPAPTARRTLGTTGACVRPATATETVLADALAEVMDTEQVSVVSHFFDDLGASSLTLAHFSARVRARALPGLSMKDIYLHPTVRSLAGALDAAATESESDRPGPPVTPPARGSTREYLLCGALQLAVFAALSYLSMSVAVTAARWILPAPDLLHLYLRAVAATGTAFVLACALPVLAKWVLVGRWVERDIRIWSLDYLRFWVVKTLIRACPLALFAGSALYVLYLRALGAKIGRQTVIFSRTVPACTDLITVGAHTVIRKGCSFTGYRAEAGVIRTGPIRLGDNVVVGDATVLDIGTEMGDGAQLGHASALHSWQRVPDGECWHGSPGRPTSVDYRVPDAADCGTLRRAAFAITQVLNLVLGVPLLVASAVSLSRSIPELGWLTAPSPLILTQGGFYLQQLELSGQLFFGGGLFALAFVITVPRALRLVVVPGRVYPLYGIAYWMYRATARITTTPFFIQLFGDSSYIVGYLRALGYRASNAGQTGSNFGAELDHEIPHLVSIAAGTMVSDGVSFRTAEFTHSSFQLSPVTLGSRSFLGNKITVPAGGRLGDNCFVGTKTMIPIDGPVRQDVGLLGSPPFEITRSQPDHRFNLSRTVFRQRLAEKNLHNTGTIVLYLAVQWVRLYLTLLVGAGSIALFDPLGVSSLVLGGLLVVAVNFAYAVSVERAATAFRPLRPKYCSIYDRYFWWHERFWKLSTQPGFLNGTPFKGMAWRMLGVRIGHRVFDDGCGISEKSLVRIGSDCTLNSGSTIQSHSMEDGIFKSDHTTIGAGCTLGPGAFVHYGVTIGDGSCIDGDSFLMKGEEVPPGRRWRGNPAREVSGAPPTAGE